MDEPVQVLWFVCKFCGRAYSCQERFLEHKKETHAEELKKEKRKSKRLKKSQKLGVIKKELLSSEGNDSQEEPLVDTLKEIETTSPVFEAFEETDEIGQLEVEIPFGFGSPERIESGETVEEPEEALHVEDEIGSLKLVESEADSSENQSSVPEVEVNQNSSESGKGHGFDDYDDSKVSVLLTPLTTEEITNRNSDLEASGIIEAPVMSSRKAGKRKGRRNFPSVRTKSKRRRKVVEEDSPPVPLVPARIQPRRSTATAQPVYTERFNVMQVPTGELDQKLRTGLRTQRASKFLNLNFDIARGEMYTESSKDVLTQETKAESAGSLKETKRHSDREMKQSDDKSEGTTTTDATEPLRADNGSLVVVESPVIDGKCGTSDRACVISEESEVKGHSNTYSCVKCVQEFRSFNEKQTHERACLMFQCKFCRVMCMDRTSLVFHEVLKHSVELGRISNLKSKSSLEIPTLKTVPDVNISNSEDIQQNVEGHVEHGEVISVSGVEENIHDISKDSQNIPTTAKNDTVSIERANNFSEDSNENEVYIDGHSHSEAFVENNVMDEDEETELAVAEDIHENIHVESVNECVNSSPEQVPREIENIDSSKSTEHIESEVIEVHPESSSFDGTEIPSSCKSPENGNETSKDIANDTDNHDEPFFQIISVIGLASILEPELSSETEATDTVLTQNNPDASQLISDSSSLPPGHEISTGVSLSQETEIHQEDDELALRMCELCGKFCRDMSALKRHTKLRHSFKKPFKCQTCPKAFKNRICLVRHKSTDKKCRESSTKMKLVQYKHSKKLRKIRLIRKFIVHKYKYGGFETSEIIVDSFRRRRIRKRKLFKCKRCNKSFQKGSKTTKLLLSQHKIILHTQEASFLCSHCGKSFRTSRSFQQHVNNHTRPRVFDCCTCPKKFISRWQLHQHHKLNLLETPISCKLCPELCTTRCQAKFHMEFHKSLPHEVAAERQADEAEGLREPRKQSKFIGGSKRKMKHLVDGVLTLIKTEPTQNETPAAKKKEVRSSNRKTKKVNMIVSVVKPKEEPLTETAESKKPESVTRSHRRSNSTKAQLLSDVNMNQQKGGQVKTGIANVRTLRIAVKDKASVDCRSRSRGVKKTGIKIVGSFVSTASNSAESLPQESVTDTLDIPEQSTIEPSKSDVETGKASRKRCAKTQENLGRATITTRKSSPTKSLNVQAIDSLVSPASKRSRGRPTKADVSLGTESLDSQVEESGKRPSEKSMKKQTKKSIKKGSVSKPFERSPGNSKRSPVKPGKGSGNGMKSATPGSIKSSPVKLATSPVKKSVKSPLKKISEEPVRNPVQKHSSSESRKTIETKKSPTKNNKKTLSKKSGEAVSIAKNPSRKSIKIPTNKSVKASPKKSLRSAACSTLEIRRGKAVKSQPQKADYRKGSIRNSRNNPVKNLTSPDEAPKWKKKNRNQKVVLQIAPSVPSTETKVTRRRRGKE